MTQDQRTIIERLTAVMDQVGAVAKGERNTQQNFNYRGIDAVVNAVSPAFREHGVVVVPVVQEYSRDQVTTSKGGLMNYVTVKVTYRFYGPDALYIEATTLGAAFDSGDKAEPKAMSVALRVALLQVLCLPTDERDVDADSHEMTRSQVKPPANDPAAEEWVEKIRATMYLGVTELVQLGQQMATEKVLQLVWEGKTLSTYLDQATTWATAKAQEESKADKATGEMKE